jgi:hypothetical protein
MQKSPLNNLIEPTTGIVHLMMPNSGGEYTLCGDAFDRPLTEEGQESMQDTTKPCNCYRCISAMNLLMPYFRKEKRRISNIVNKPFDMDADLW